jgi:hypothetical protein
LPLSFHFSEWMEGKGERRKAAAYQLFCGVWIGEESEGWRKKESIFMRVPRKSIAWLQLHAVRGKERERLAVSRVLPHSNSISIASAPFLPLMCVCAVHLVHYFSLRPSGKWSYCSFRFLTSLPWYMSINGNAG